MGMNMITINKTNPIYLSNKKQSNKNEKTYSSIKPTSTSFGGNPLLSKKTAAAVAACMLPLFGGVVGFSAVAPKEKIPALKSDTLNDIWDNFLKKKDKDSATNYYWENFQDTLQTSSCDLPETALQKNGWHKEFIDLFKKISWHVVSEKTPNLYVAIDKAGTTWVYDVNSPNNYLKIQHADIYFPQLETVTKVTLDGTTVYRECKNFTTDTPYKFAVKTSIESGDKKNALSDIMESTLTPLGEAFTREDDNVWVSASVCYTGQDVNQGAWNQATIFNEDLGKDQDFTSAPIAEKRDTYLRKFYTGLCKNFYNRGNRIPNDGLLQYHTKDKGEYVCRHMAATLELYHNQYKSSTHEQLFSDKFQVVNGWFNGSKSEGHTVCWDPEKHFFVDVTNGQWGDIYNNLDAVKNAANFFSEDGVPLLWEEKDPEKCEKILNSLRSLGSQCHWSSADIRLISAMFLFNYANALEQRQDGGDLANAKKAYVEASKRYMKVGEEKKIPIYTKLATECIRRAELTTQSIETPSAGAEKYYNLDLRGEMVPPDLAGIQHEHPQGNAGGAQVEQQNQADPLVEVGEPVVIAAPEGENPEENPEYPEDMKDRGRGCCTFM